MAMLLVPFGLGALLVCCLKGRWLESMAAVALFIAVTTLLIVRGDASAADVSTGTRAIMEGGFALFAVVAALGAARAARRGTWWDRRTAVDRDGETLLSKEPARSRLVRALAGLALGTVPGALLILGVIVADLITDISNDASQIGFLAIPLGFFGAIAGAVVGYGWVPRRLLLTSVPDADRPVSANESQAGSPH